MLSLERFISEVVEKGAEACLPRNLSSEWLLVVAAGIEGLLAPFDDAMRLPDGFTEAELKAIGLAALLTLLREKGAPQTESELEISFDDLARCVDEYRLELGFEEIHRKTDIKYEQASLANIFTNRNVKTWKVPRSGKKP